MTLPESNMADGHHLEFPLSLPLPRCLPCFIMKLRDPFTHFKRENLCLIKCIRGPKPDPGLNSVSGSQVGGFHQLHERSEFVNKQSEAKR